MLKVNDLVIMRNQGVAQEIKTYFELPSFPKRLVALRKEEPPGSFVLKCLSIYNETQGSTKEDVVIVTPLFRFPDETP